MNQPTTFLIRKEFQDGNYVHIYINWPACEVDQAVAYEISKNFANMELLPTRLTDMIQWGLDIDECDEDLGFIRYDIINIHQFLKQVACEGLAQYHLYPVKMPSNNELLNFLNCGVIT